MTRARFYDVSTDPAGRPLPGVTVNVYTTGTTTPLPVTIYAAATGAATRANPFVTATGVVDFWLEDPAVVDVKYTLTGYGTQTQTVEVVESTPPATAVTVTPVGGLAATTAQAALAELDADLTAEAAARGSADTAETAARIAADAAAAALSLGTFRVLPSGIVSGTAAGITLKDWVQGEAYEPTAITRDANDVVTSATVKWPDGSAGTFTATTINATWLAIDAFTVSHTSSGLTVTQAAVTRNANGAVTTKPALTVA